MTEQADPLECSCPHEHSNSPKQPKSAAKVGKFGWQSWQHGSKALLAAHRLVQADAQAPVQDLAVQTCTQGSQEGAPLSVLAVEGQGGTHTHGSA